MNARQELMAKIEGITADERYGKVAEDIKEVIKDFVDDIEGKFNDIANLLSGISIDTLDNVEDAKAIAGEAGFTLY